MRISTAAFTRAGSELARRLAVVANGHDWAMIAPDAAQGSGSLRDRVARAFATADALVFVGAAGIAVRMIAPLLASKDRDPAVLVIDEQAAFVISLLSGHLGGANDLAVELAARLGAVPVITTATDRRGVFAVDAWSRRTGCVIAEIERIRPVSAALLRGERVGLHSDFPVGTPLPDGLSPDGNAAVGVCVSLDETRQPFTVTLHVVPRIVVLGAGCRRHADTAEFEAFALETLAARGVAIRAACRLASLDRKRDEPCLTRFAAKYGLAFMTFSAGRLREVDGVFAGSGFVMSRTGVDNVCERAAVAAGGATMLIPKTSGRGMTLAAAALPWTCRFDPGPALFGIESATNRIRRCTSRSQA